MESIHFQHNALTAAEITTRRLCRLHRVRLFSPALCRVKRGSKVIVQGESRVLATPQQLIVLPAGEWPLLLRSAIADARAADEV